MMILRNDFLTIPDAPNYEINSELICRNKTTGRLLKPQMQAGAKYYRVYLGKDNLIHRSAKNFYDSARLANAEWVPVPSLDYKYEFTPRGILRNRQSKRVIQLCDGVFYIRNKHITKMISPTSLLWECFGRIPTTSVKKPVILSKGGSQIYFESIAATARFLAEKTFYSFSRMIDLLSEREKNIHGWNVNYLHEQTATVDSALRGAYYGPYAFGRGKKDVRHRPKALPD